MIDWFGHLYPYTNVHELNLDWVIATVKAGEKEIKNFVGLNTIKYADPILWNITSQYETNTVVVDGQTGNAYISVQPVPVGVALSRTEYWTAIFNYGTVVDTLMSQIASNEGLSPTATQAYNVNDLVFSQGMLYIVASPIIAGDSFVDGSNVNKTTVDEVIQSLRNNLDSETTARTDADTALQGNIDAEATARTDADTAISDRITSIETDIANSKIVYNVKEYGAVGNGTTDDTTAILAAVSDCNSTGGVVYFPHGSYKVTQPIVFTRFGCSVKGESAQGTYLLVYHNGSGIVFGDGTNTKQSPCVMHIGIVNNGTPSDYQYGVFYNNVVNGIAMDVIISNFKRGFGLNHAGNTFLYSVGVVSNVANATGIYVYNQSVSSAAENCYCGFFDDAKDTGVGLSITNGDVADFTVKYLDVGNGAFGIYIDGADSPSDFPPADIRLYDVVADNCIQSIRINNINERGNVLISGGWLNPRRGVNSPCVYLNNANNVTIDSVSLQQLLDAIPDANGVYVYGNSNNVKIVNCRFINLATCITNDSTARGLSVMGCTFTRYSDISTTGSAMAFVTLENSMIVNNFIGAGFINGVYTSGGTRLIVKDNIIRSGSINVGSATIVTKAGNIDGDVITTD